MKTRLLKEFRLLLPVFMVTALLSILPLILWNPQSNEFASFIHSFTSLFFLGGIGLMGCVLFGSELHYRTLPLLLSQPISRKIIWREKMIALGTTLALSLAAMMLCLRWHPNRNLDQPISPGALPLISLCALCTTPFWTLFLRNAINAIAISLLTPAALKAVLETIDAHLLHNRMTEPVYACTFGLYSALLYFLGYKIFLRLELTGSDAGPTIPFPRTLGSRVSLLADKMFARFHHPVAILIAKEIRLQRSVFVIAGSFMLLVLIAANVLIFSPANDTVSFGMPLLNICFLIYIALIPLLTSATSFAEERNWGLSEWHLTLPVSAFKQWTIKLLITFATSVALGLLLPGACYAVVYWIVSPGIVNHLTRPDFLTLGIESFYILLVYTLLTSLAVYASSFSDNVIRAILRSFGMVLLMMTVAGLSMWYWNMFCSPNEQTHSQTPNTASFHLLQAEMLLLICLLTGATFSNFRFRGLPRKLSAFGTVAILILTGIFTLSYLVTAWTTDSDTDSSTPPPKIFYPRHSTRSQQT